jgi:hypothetical protein
MVSLEISGLSRDLLLLLHRGGHVTSFCHDHGDIIST